MKSKILFLFFALLAITLEMNAQATLSMQGTIRNSTGSAVSDGTYSLTFKLYTAESGGTAVWTETQDNIKVVGGVYSALLGTSNPLNAAFNVPYYVGISVDGGSELIPRFRLTSAPYALSLIGQGNTFPSAGTVGIGTASPDPNTALTVSGGSGDGKLLITAPGNKDAIFWMRSGNNLSGLTMGSNGNFDINAPGNIFVNAHGGRVHLYGNGGPKAYTDEDGFVVNGRLTSTGTLWTQNGDISSGNGTDLRLYRNADLHILCRGDGWTEMKKALYIPGQISQYFLNTMALFPRALSNGLVTTHSEYLPMQRELFALNGLLRPRIVVSKLICTGVRVNMTSPHCCKLEVTDYRHVDSIANGSGVVKGFIAQQVKEVFPQAVSTAKNTIPDILAKPASMQVNGDVATFNMPAGNNLVKGDRVRIFQNGGEQKEYDVVDTQGSSFTVKGWNAAFNEVDKVFVYGKEVNDFCQVDYDKIHNLNVSATQELARQVEQLRAENAALRSQYDSMLRASEAVNGRLAKLEALLDSSASKR
jgi:hypothetical protein